MEPKEGIRSYRDGPHIGHVDVVRDFYYTTTGKGQRT